MSEKIKTIVVGYGNIGKAVHDVVKENEEKYRDITLVGIISRDRERVLKEVKDLDVPVFDIKDKKGWSNLGTEVAFLCGGSKKDLFGDEKEVSKILKNKILLSRIIMEGDEKLLELGQGPYFAQYFEVTVDSFDTHPRILSYSNVMDRVTRSRSKLAVISTGWDPGTFSTARIAFDSYAIGPKPKPFYGTNPRGGKSMGHSNALLGIKGVKYAIQYTHAIPELIEKARNGEEILEGEKTVIRECIITLENWADNPKEKERIEKETKKMKSYFKGYKTSVEFVSEEEFLVNHSNSKQHNGLVIATGKTGSYPSKHEFFCEYESNSHGTAGIMVATARGAYRLKQEGKTGAITLADIPVTYLSPHSREELLRDFM